MKGVRPGEGRLATSETEASHVLIMMLLILHQILEAGQCDVSPAVTSWERKIRGNWNWTDFLFAMHSLHSLFSFIEQIFIRIEIILFSRVQCQYLVQFPFSICIGWIYIFLQILQTLSINKLLHHSSSATIWI